MLTLPLTLGVGIPLKARNTLSESEFFSLVFVAAQCEHYLDFYRPQRSCGKVMFSQACVKNSVNREGVSASVHAGIHPPGQTPPGRHPPAVTAADGTDPTGMHSYL